MSHLTCSPLCPALWLVPGHAKGRWPWLCYAAVSSIGVGLRCAIPKQASWLLGGGLGSLCPPKARSRRGTRRQNVGSGSQTCQCACVIPGTGGLRLDITQVVFLTIPASRLSMASCPWQHTLTCVHVAYPICFLFQPWLHTGTTVTETSDKKAVTGTMLERRQKSSSRICPLFPLLWPLEPAALSSGSLPMPY